MFTLCIYSVSSRWVVGHTTWMWLQLVLSLACYEENSSQKDLVIRLTSLENQDFFLPQVSQHALWEEYLAFHYCKPAPFTEAIRQFQICPSALIPPIDKWPLLSRYSSIIHSFVISTKDVLLNIGVQAQSLQCQCSIKSWKKLAVQEIHLAQHPMATELFTPCRGPSILKNPENWETCHSSLKAGLTSGSYAFPGSWSVGGSSLNPHPFAICESFQLWHPNTKTNDQI
jgi:hypothetical protein